MTEEKVHPWNVLSNVPYADHIEKKGNLSYISWAWGWSIVKKHFPDATFDKHLFDQPDGSKLPYMKDQIGNAYVVVSVYISDDHDVTEVFPVTDFKNKAIKNPSSQDVSNAFQRALAKCFAYFGLGIHLYTNEDIPSESNDSAPSERKIKNAGSDLSPLEQHTKFCADAAEYIETIDNLPDLNHYFNSEIKDRLSLIDQEAPEQGNSLKVAVSKQKASLTSEDIPFD
jgi:hypothetical protein